jgi:hypothetical protein
MGCNHNNINCGCKDNYLTTPPACPTPVECPDVQPCAEIFPAQCIVYTGEDIECNQEVVISQNASVSTALENIVDYICSLAGNIPITIVEGEGDIEVTSETVGTTTTYTVSYTGLQKYTNTFVMDTLLVIPVAHNLGTDIVSVTLIDDTTDTPLIYGTDYTVTVVDSNTVNLSRTDAGGLTRILIIG